MAHENVQLVVETLEKLRNYEAFNKVRRKSNDQVTEVLKFIEKEELACSLKKVQVPRASFSTLKRLKTSSDPRWEKKD